MKQFLIWYSVGFVISYIVARIWLNSEERTWERVYYCLKVAAFSWLGLACLGLGLFFEYLELKIKSWKVRANKSKPPRWL